jgi:hypothetical protein
MTTISTKRMLKETMKLVVQLMAMLCVDVMQSFGYSDDKKSTRLLLLLCPGVQQG